MVLVLFLLLLLFDGVVCCSCCLYGCFALSVAGCCWLFCVVSCVLFFGWAGCCHWFSLLVVVVY